MQSHINETLRMDSNRRPVVNEMLNLTLEILYLLTGENYIAFKLSDGWVGPYMKNTQNPTMEPLSASPTSERSNDKILEITQKIIELLTGEVPIRCQDVTVSLEVEKLQSSEGHKEVVVENYPTLDFNGDAFYSPGPLGGLPTTTSNGQVNEARFITAMNRQGVSATGEEDIVAGTMDNLNQMVSVQDGNAVANIYKDHGYTSVYTKEVLVSMTNGDLATIYAQPEDIEYISGEVAEICVTCDEEQPVNIICSPRSEHPDPLAREENANSSNGLPNPCKAKSRKRMARSMAEGDLCRNLGFKKGQGQEDFSCSQCSKRFSCRSLLTRHERIHSGLKPFACLECGRCFNRVENLATHTRIHKGEKPFTCPCGRVFLRKESLILHKRTHSGERPFSCADCGKSFTSNSDLVRHKRIHLNQRPFLCSECGKSFMNKADLGRHQKTHQDKIIPCPECKRRFATVSDLSRHLRRHQNPPLQFPCPECGKQFQSKSELSRHEVTHSGEKPFECPECRKRFGRAYNLEAHMKTHLGEKPFTCVECGKRFLRKSQLTLHERTHTGERPYSCSECGKRFAGSSDLIKHQRLHTGEKPYSCNNCGRRFTNKPDLTKHCRVHSKGMPFVCTQCNECFAKRVDLLMHEKAHTEGPAFCCLVCGQLFSSDADLVSHQGVHSEDGPGVGSESRKQFQHEISQSGRLSGDLRNNSDLLTKDHPDSEEVDLSRELVPLP